MIQNYICSSNISHDENSEPKLKIYGFARDTLGPQQRFFYSHGVFDLSMFFLHFI